MNFYMVLGISPDSSGEMIRNAYRMLARLYHPDRGVGSSVEKFRQVTEAYEMLINPESRRRYDLSLTWKPAPTQMRVEPMVGQSRYFPQEYAGVYGIFLDWPQRGRFGRLFDVDGLLNRWLIELGRARL